MRQLSLQKSKRFSNNIEKVRAILSVFKRGEKLPGDEIARRLEKQGYVVDSAHLRMFIHYNMLHRYLRKEVINRKVHYSLIN